MLTRRNVLGLSLVPLIGCSELQERSEPTPSGDRDDLPSADQIGGVYVVLLDDVHEDEPVTDHDDQRIAEVDVIQSLIEEATDPDADLGAVEGTDYTYETTMEGRGGDLGPDDLERAVHALDELPQGSHPDLDERGWYIRHHDQLLRFNYVEYD